MRIRVITVILLGIFSLLLASCAKNPKSPAEIYKGQTAGQIFVGAEKAIAKHKYAEATKRFEALDALYPFSKYSEQGQLDSIYAYYKLGDSASALAAADRYIRLYPRSPKVDYAYYMKGLVNFQRESNWLTRLFPTDPAQRDLTYMRKSFNNFNTLVQLFPNSRYAPDARRRMVYIRNLLAKHELEVAQFYMKRKAYVAAANRASTIVKHYQRSPSVIKALAILVKANRALGNTKAANQALKVLQASYPNSAEARKLSR